jgi:prepilin signal peptidase PulO-like enzyme (type II secretory pathway)
MIIPDWINLLLWGTGIGLALLKGADSAWSTLVFSGAVFSCFWGVRTFHCRLTGRAGLGMGDVKLAGAAAAWLTPLSFPIFLLAGSLSALAYFVVAYRGHPDPYSVRIPFGPFLATSLLALWHFEKIGIQLLGFQT